MTIGKGAGLADQITHDHSINCPMCGQHVRVPTVDMVVHQYSISGFQEAILRTVWKGRGLPVATDLIFDAMYADDPDGGPSMRRMYRALYEAMSRLRETLATSGISIVNHGYGRGYRLVFGEE